MEREIKIYRGKRRGWGCEVTVENLETGSGPIPLRHVIYHSPTGFEWGYGGSGPADLALSILADALGEHPTSQEIGEGTSLAWRQHQAFKWAMIAGAPKAEFTIRLYSDGSFSRDVDGESKLFRISEEETKE